MRATRVSLYDHSCEPWKIQNPALLPQTPTIPRQVLCTSLHPPRSISDPIPSRLRPSKRAAGAATARWANAQIPPSSAASGQCLRDCDEEEEEEAVLWVRVWSRRCVMMGSVVVVVVVVVVRVASGGDGGQRIRKRPRRGAAARA